MQLNPDISRKNGFTLVEIMIVIAIIGVLSVALFPSLGDYMERSKNTARVSQMRNTIEKISQKYPESLVANYTFEEWNWNTVIDYSTYYSNNVLFATGTMTYKRWHIWKWIECSNQWESNLDGSLNIPNTLSIVLWIYADSIPTGYATHPVSKWSSTTDANYVFYFFWATAGGLLWRVWFYGNAGWSWRNISNTTILPLKKWTMVGLSYDAIAGWQLYMDWYPVWLPVLSPGVLATNNIKNRLCMSSASFSGMLDDIQIYKAQLTSQDMLDIYNAWK